MKVLIVLATVMGVTFASLDDDWALWKSQYTKSYEDEATESVRRLVWEDNWRFVQQHNSEGHSFEVEMNEYADLVSEASDLLIHDTVMQCCLWEWCWRSNRSSHELLWGVVLSRVYPSRGLFQFHS